MYKNQYFITNAKCTTACKEVTLLHETGLDIYHHESLNVSTAKAGTTTVIVLGHIINPFYPSETDDDITRTLAWSCATMDSLFKELSQLSGRFVVLYKNEDGFIAVNDACALKQLYYGFRGEDIILTSSPKMFLDFYGTDLEISEEKKELIGLDNYLSNECLWFGDSCIDNRLRKVLSNHYLDITNKKTGRVPFYFEGFPTEQRTLEYAAAMLQGSIQAAAKRYRVIQPLTCGCDSRVLLSAAKQCKDDITFYVFDLSNGDERHPDVWVPRKLSEKLDLNFQLIQLEDIKEEFLALYEKEHVLPQVWPKIAQYQYLYEHQSLPNTVRVSGVGGGIIKCFYGYTDNANVHVNMLMHFSGYEGKSRLVNREIASWLPGARHYAEQYGIGLLDLFHWEQKTANWGAFYAFEQDIAIDEFSPFYNRNFLLSVLKISPRRRCKPKCAFFRDLIKYLWEDTLFVPISPDSSFRDLRWIFKNNSVLDYYKFRTKSAVRALLGKTS